MIKTEFMELYEELTKLNEFFPNASQRFWTAAKNNKLNDTDFHSAYDAELTELGLMDIFNADGTLINKGVYGRIKNAKEANPDSWALKALSKFWALQFKDGVKTNSQISHEKEEAERVEIETRYTAVKEKWDILNEKLPFVQHLIESTVNKYAAAKKEILKSDLEQALALKTEMTTATRGLLKFYDNTDEYNLALLNKGDDLIKVSVTLEALDERFPRALIWVEVRQFFSAHPTFKAWGKTAAHTFSLTVEDLDENIITSKIISLLDNIWELVSFRFTTIDKTQKKYEEVTPKIATAKAAQVSVDTGRPVDPNFISEVLAEFTKGREKANSEADFYSDVQDGSSGAAFAMKKYEAIVAAGIYLVNCNWCATIGDTEIATWRTTDSVENLENALANTFDAFSRDLTIEIIK